MDDIAMKITLKEVYQKLEAFECKNNIDHQTIIHNQDMTNGKVKLNRWLATTAITLSLVAIGWVLAIIK
jgi:hypothetical protein